MAKDYTTPKQLLPVAGKPVLEHTLDNLPEIIQELVFVVGGPHEHTIRQHFAHGRHNDRPITFVRQDEPLGTAHAFWSAAEHVTGPFLAMFGDDIHSREPLRELLTHNENAILARRVARPEIHGVLVCDAGGYLTHVVEKPQEFVSDLVITGAMLLDEDFVRTHVGLSARGEYEYVDVLTHLVEHKNKRFKIVETEEWLPVNNKDELEQARLRYEEGQRKD